MNLIVNGIFLVSLMMLLSYSEAAVEFGFFKDAKHPGKCVIKPNLILSIGDEAPYPDYDCARVICGTESMAQIHTCGVIGPPPGYKLGAPKHPNAHYPDCCDREFVKA